MTVYFNTWGDNTVANSTPSDISNGRTVFGSTVLANPEQSRTINPDQQTFVLAHGWGSPGGGGNPQNKFQPTEWVAEAANNLRIRYPDANIIVVDWTDDAGVNNEPLTYRPSAQNTETVGGQLGEYINQIGVNPNNTAIIGHSLGAHIAGAAAARYERLTNNRLGLAIHLDAAAPEFQREGFLGEESLFGDALDNLAAQGNFQRQVGLHTAPRTAGLNDEIGDLDIYVNQESSRQPTDSNNHSYAHELFRDLLKGIRFLQRDGSEFNLDTLFSSTQTGRVDVNTRSNTFLGTNVGLFGDGSNRLSLGTPAFASFVEYNGGDFRTASNLLFPLGTLTYQNGVTDLGSEPQDNLPFTIGLLLTAPVEEEQTFSFSFDNIATSNDTGNNVLDGDILTFSTAGNSEETFTVDGTNYALKLFGFSTDGGETQVGEFRTPENDSVTATLFAKIVPVSAEVPTISETTLDLFQTATDEATLGALKDAFFRISNSSMFESPLMLAEPQSSISEDPAILLANSEDQQLIASSSTSNATADPFVLLASSDSQEPTTFQGNPNTNIEPFFITQDISDEFTGGVVGTNNNDWIVGSPVNDVSIGLQGADFITGSLNTDYIRGVEGNDELYGGQDDDIMNGNQDDDFVSGDRGNDLLRGGQNNDILVGGDGNDVLIGDRGTDRLIGQVGADVFILRTDTGEFKSEVSTADIILDFNPAENDIIALNDGMPLDVITLEAADVNQDGIGDTIIQFVETNQVGERFTNIFGVVLSTSPDVVENALLTLGPEDAVMFIG